MNTDPLYNPYAPPAAPTGYAALQSEEGSSYAAEQRSVLLLVFLSVVTLGIYPAVWFVRRRRFLDSLNADVKLGGLAWAPLIATGVSFIAAFAGLPSELDRAVSLGLGVASIVLAFRVANILRSDFARTGRLLSVSGAGTFFFGALYLQHKINQAAATPPRHVA
jgi:hypothetical protein